jgi:hypothetical protein
MLFGCTLYWNMNRNYTFPPKGQKLLNNRVGSFFFLLMNAYFGVLTNTTYKMSKENIIIYKEIKSRMYSVSNYFYAKTIVDLVFLILPIVCCIFPVSKPTKYATLTLKSNSSGTK